MMFLGLCGLMIQLLVVIVTELNMQKPAYYFELYGFLLPHNFYTLTVFSFIGRLVFIGSKNTAHKVAQRNS
jgi:hypothetical protein